MKRGKPKKSSCNRVVLRANSSLKCGVGISSSYKDESGNDVSHGISLVFYADGKLKSNATFWHGVLHGENERRFSNGQIAGRGSYSHGKKIGIWRTWYVDGHLRDILRYKHGKLHGKCIYYWHPKFPADSRVFTNGIETTKGIIRRIKYRSCYYENKKLKQQESYYLHHGKEIRHGTFFDGKQDGSYIEIPYKDGIPYGRGAFFNLHGELVREYVIDKHGRKMNTNFSKLE